MLGLQPAGDVGLHPQQVGIHHLLRCCPGSLPLLRSRHQLISLLLEKLLKLDAHLSRSAIEESNRAAAAGEQETVNPLVAALDVYMKAMFIDIEENLHTEGQYDGKKGEEMVALLLDRFCILNQLSYMYCSHLAFQCRF